MNARTVSIAHPGPRRPGWRMRALAAALAAAMAVPFAPTAAFAQNALPSLGESSSDDLSVGSERRLGDQIMRDIRRDPDYLDDPILNDYVDTLWEPLVAASRRLGNITPDIDGRFAWESFLVRDRTVNAFALPGGFIGLHLGLISLTSSRDELASVMAHELSHVTQRHIARGVGNSQKQSMIALAAMIIGILAATRSNSPDGFSAAVTGSQAVGIQGQLNFSRDVEREADRVGFNVLSAAGFAPSGMAAMFEKLASASRLTDSNLYPYLRSHPLTTERIGEARSRLGTAGGRIPVPVQSSLFEHAVMQGRARALMDPRADTWLRLQQQDSAATRNDMSVSERLIALSAAAIASSQLRDTARAEAAANAALGLVRGSPRSDSRAERAVQELRAQIAIDGGDPMAAAQALEAYAGDDARAMVLLRAQIALATKPNGSPRDPAVALRNSAEALQTRVALQPRDALAWDLLAQTEERLDQPLRALRAQGEARYASGDLSGAIDRLKAGQRSVRSGVAVDFVEASVIDARLREIEGQRRELAAQLKGDPQP